MEEFKPSYLAFLDVLGFSEMIARGREFEKIFKSYIGIIRNTISWVDNSFTYSVFSDTIIIFTNNSQWATLEKLIRIVSRISYALLMDQNVPVKAAIAHGRFTNFVKDEDRILAGKPIVEAYRYEQNQNWIGAMLAPSVLRNVNDIHKRIHLRTPNLLGDEKVKSRIKKNMQLILSISEYDIPFKEGEQYHGIAIIPKRLNSNDPYYLCEDLHYLSEKIKELKMQAENPYIQLKYKNTELFLNAMQDKHKRLHSNIEWKKAFWENENGNLSPFPRKP